jgi:hypothetical protein
MVVKICYSFVELFFYNLIMTKSFKGPEGEAGISEKEWAVSAAIVEGTKTCVFRVLTVEDERLCAAMREDMQVVADYCSERGAQYMNVVLGENESAAPVMRFSPFDSRDTDYKKYRKDNEDC